MKTMRVLPSIMLVLILGLTGCHQEELSIGDERPVEEEIEFNIGVLVGSGGIDDQGFNQGAWDAIVQFTEKNPRVKAQMIIPKDEDLTEYLDAIKELNTIKSDVIIALGPEFNEAIEQVQHEDSEEKYILLDGDLDQINENTVVVSFAQQEVGFLAGVAAALQSPNEKLGFIGGTKHSNIQRYGLGFEAGVAYANEFYDTQAKVLNVQYEGSFNRPDEGQRLAKEMFEQGIDTIFVAAHGTGIGAMNEAKVRLEQDEQVYMIGADIDQFDEGKLNEGISVVLTSATLNFERALHELLDQYADDKFPGGELIEKNLKNNGIGLPEKNYNFSKETEVKIQEVMDAISSGEISIPDTLEELRAR